MLGESQHIGCDPLATGRLDMVAGLLRDRGSEIGTVELDAELGQGILQKGAVAAGPGGPSVSLHLQGETIPHAVGQQPLGPQLLTDHELSDIREQILDIDHDLPCDYYRNLLVRIHGVDDLEIELLHRPRGWLGKHIIRRKPVAIAVPVPYFKEKG